MQTAEELIKEFVIQKDVYDKLCHKASSIITDLINESNIQTHQISFRVKTKKKIEEKIIRKNFKYKGISEITDIVGIRIITYFADDVDKVEDLIEQEFVIDKKNSIDKRNLEEDRFGYMSLHYVVELPKARTILTENKKFENIKLEIQIRSVLQHSWAEIEHDLGYKGSIAIPRFAKRNFHRIAALLEIADIEFNSLRQILEEYKEQVSLDINQNKRNLLIDQTTLTEYINQSKILGEIENKIVRKFKKQRQHKHAFTPHVIESRLQAISDLNIKSIEELDELLKKNKKQLSDYMIHKYKILSDSYSSWQWILYGSSINDLNEMISKEDI